MKIAIDVLYKNDTARTAGVLFNEWNEEQASGLVTRMKTGISEYIPGEFYKRELPCLLDLIAVIAAPELIIIDGYVYLDDNRKKGLGAYLYEALNEKVPVIGVAKTGFHNNKLYVKEVLRGSSKNPLYITAVGTSLRDAAFCVQQMHGQHRIPSLLKLVDTATREWE